MKTDQHELFLARKRYRKWHEKDPDHVRALWRERCKRYREKKRKMDRKEAKIEAVCMKRFRRAGGYHRKMDRGHGAKGWLDQACWSVDGFHFLVEFKIPGTKPTRAQEEKIEWFTNCGYKVFVIRSEEEWEEQVEAWLREKFMETR